MKISIITATFNSAKTIERCLSSVLQQTYTNFEYILIDGGSIDDTVERVRFSFNHKKGQEIQIITEPDRGIYDALNKGISLAKGDLIGFVHSDDFLADNNVLSQIAEQFIGEDKIDGIYGDLHYVDKTRVEKIIRNWKSCSFEYKLLKSGWMPPHPTLFLRKEVYEKHGHFNLSYKISGDYDFILRVFSDHKLRLKYLPIVIMKMRIGGISNASIETILTKLKEDYLAICNNDLKSPILILIKKNLSKISQFTIFNKLFKFKK